MGFYGMREMWFVWQVWELGTYLVSVPCSPRPGAIQMETWQGTARAGKHTWRREEVEKGIGQVSSSVHWVGEGRPEINEADTEWSANLGDEGGPRTKAHLSRSGTDQSSSRYRNLVCREEETGTGGVDCTLGGEVSTDLWEEASQ